MANKSYYGDRPLMNLSFHEHMKLTSASTWVTNDNRRIKVKDMKDDHLVRTIRHVAAWGELARTKEFLEVAAWGEPRGEMAAEAWDSELYVLSSPFTFDSWLAGHCPPWRNLLKEAERRGLAVSETSRLN